MRDSRKLAPRLIAKVILASGVLLLSFLSSPASQGDPETIRIGVLAKRGLRRCLQKWGPTVEHLNREIPGRRFQIVPLGFV